MRIGSSLGHLLLGVGGGAARFSKRLTHKDVGKLNFDSGRNASCHPVGDPLLSVLAVAKQPCDLQRAAQFEDEFFVFHSRIKHCVDLIVNNMFNNGLHILFMLAK